MATVSALLGQTTGSTVSERSELTVTTLVNELVPVAAKWETLGQKLGLQEWKLNNIEADYPVGRGASIKRLNAVLVEWYNNTTERSWGKIVCILREMDENIPAREIERKYFSTVRVTGLSQTLSCEAHQKQSNKAVALLHENDLMLKDQFAQVLTFVYEKIQERLDAKEIKIKSFRVYMTNLFPPGECIPDTKDVCLIFTAITKNCLWDYLNCEPLVRVAKMYGGKDPDLNMELEAYNQAVVGYKIVTKMADYLSHVTVKNSNDSEKDYESSSSPVRKDQQFRRKLTVKLDIPVGGQSLEYVDEIWNSLSKKFCLPSSSAILEKIIEGSLVITWLIPALFVPQIMEIAKQPEMIEYFQNTRITEITVDDACLYEDQEVESSLGFTEAAAVKSVNDKFSSYPHSHTEPDLPQPRVTGYDVELVNESRDLHCPICLLVLRDPMQVNCCGKRYCCSCIKTVVKEGKPCPACKCESGDYDIFEDKGLKQTLLGMKVYCSNWTIGCGWKGELHQLNNHMYSCPQRQLYTCPYCKCYSSAYLDVCSRHLSVCEKFPVQCSMKMPQKSLQQHLCEKNKDPSHQNTATPISLEIHSPVFFPPPKFIMADFTNLKENKIIWNSSPFYSHFGGYKMCLDVRAYGVVEGAGTHVSVYVCLMRGEYDNNLLWPFRGDVTFQVVNQRGNAGHVEHTVIFDDRANEIAGRVTEVEKARGWGHATVIPHSALYYDDSLNTEYLKNDFLEIQVSQVKLSRIAEGVLADAQSRQSSNTEQLEILSIPPVKIVMTDFIFYKNTGCAWYSPPFYSHIEGYKFCLIVYANGLGNGTGTHVSVAMCLMCGEYDDNLEWPFRGEIVFELVNQRRIKGLVDVYYQEHVVIFDDHTPDTYAGRVTESERALEKMCSPYTYPHSVLHYCESRNTEYLRNNSLEFLISQVKVYTSQQKQHQTVFYTNEQMMKDHFTQLQLVVCEKIQKRLNAKKINFRDFHVYITTLFPHLECIPTSLDVSEIFTIIKNNCLWDYINCEALMRVAKMYGGKDPDLKLNLEKYNKELTGYKMVTKITDHLSTLTSIGNTSPPIMARYDKHFCSELTVMFKIPINTLSLSDIDDIWKSLAEWFLPPPSSAILDKIISGSLCVTWLIPALFVPQVMEMADQPEIIELFQNMKVEMAKVDGAYIYGEHEEQEDSAEGQFGKDLELHHKPEGQELAADSSQEERVELVSYLNHNMQKSSIEANDKPSEHYHLPSESYLHSPQLQVTGYNVELVKESPDLHCPICIHVLRDPIQVNCCGKRFCRSCIETIVAGAKPCPACKCKAGNFNTFEDKGQKQEILEVKVYCTNKNVGCGWTGELCQLNSHLNLNPKGEQALDLGCPYTKITCIHCSEDCYRYHMRSCPQQPYICPYCKHYSSTYEDIYSNHLSLCDEFPVHCKVCSVKMPRKSLLHHHLECDGNDDSSNESFATPFQLATVELPSLVFVPPPTFIMDNFSRHKEGKVSWHSSPFYSHAGGYKMCLQVDASGRKSSTGTHVSVYVCLLCGEFDCNLTWPFKGNTIIQLVNQRRGEGHVKYTVAFNDCTPHDCAGQVIKSKRSVEWGSHNFIPHSSLHYDELWNTEYLKNDCLEFRISQVKLSKIANRLLAEVHEQQTSDKTEQPKQVPTPPVYIIMNNFISYKKRDVAWNSPPFYSHAGGYKMFLQVHANGIESCAGTHVSVVAHLMHGEYDDNLVWPFRGIITLQLGDQRRDEATITYDDRTPDKYADRLTENKISAGWACPNFIPHSVFHNDIAYNESRSTEYLRNDCLKFQVTHIQLNTETK